MEFKHHARLAYKNASGEKKRNYQLANAECQKGIREAQYTWWHQKSENLQMYAAQRLTRRFLLQQRRSLDPLDKWFSTFHRLWPPSKDSQHLWPPDHQ